jgi:g-D-glutamyl-meso-diaminopimelate peptidase
VPLPPFKFTQTMRLGSRGTQVIELQKFLNKFENSNLVEDGWFGQITLAVVKLFQQHHGLTPDGIFGIKSRTAANLLI